MTKHISSCCIIAGIFLGAVQLFAAPNLLTNPGFEDPVLSKDSSWYGSINGWTLGGVPTYGTTWAHPFNATTPCPEGNQHVWGSVNQLYMEQTCGTIQNDTVYTFSVDLYRMDPQGSGNSVQVGIVDGTAGGYIVVKDYQPTYDPSKKDFVFLTDQWTTVTVEFNSANEPGRIGNVMKPIINTFLCAIDNAIFTTGAAEKTVYYISSSTGNDSFDGLTPGTAWQSFTNVNALTLQPDDTVLLKRGDSWNQELNLSGSGTATDPITLGAYGTGAKPRIERSDITWDRCAVINDASYWEIRDLDFRTARLGLYLRYYNDYYNNDVFIHSCFFSNMSSSTVFHPSSNNYEYAWSASIFLGGKVNTFSNPNDIVLDGLVISNCFANDGGVFFIDNWYWPSVYKRRLRNMLITDCVASNCLGGILQLNCASESRMTRSRAIRCGGYYENGVTAGFSQSCTNCVIDDCEFSYTIRDNCADGTGWDYEGDCDDCKFINNVVHDNDGAALLTMATIRENLRETISSNTFYNNCRNPNNADNNNILQCHDSDCTGWVVGNGMYRGSANSEGTPGYFSSRWTGHTLSGNRQNTYSSVSSRQVTWEFNSAGDFEGWSNFTDWSPSVSGGTLNGSSTGTNPFGYSGDTWVNTHHYRYMRIRMSVDAGTTAQIYFITETDSTWNNMPPYIKQHTFSITTDGTQREYVIDMRSVCPGYQGVITAIRLHPSNVSGANIAVDYVRFTTN